jgi:hypothetical protein
MKASGMKNGFASGLLMSAAAVMADSATVNAADSTHHSNSNYLAMTRLLQQFSYAILRRRRANAAS